MRFALFLLALPAFAQTAVIKTNPHPVWGNTQTWKVGATNGLDGSGSTGGFTGYNWSCTSFNNGSGAASCAFLMFSSTTVAMPTVTGAVFGDYTIQLCDGMNANCGTIHIGAVAYDANGVVTQSDPNVTKVFGPQIAWGQNPWGYADERNAFTANAQIAYQASHNDFSWTTTGQGTISYPYAGRGFISGSAASTTLTAGITSTATSIAVADASVLSLTSLPTWIEVGTAIGNFEVIRICGTTGTTGAQTLTVCYDGRGISGNNTGLGGYYTSVGASPWSMGSTVGEYRIQGSGTLFATDSARPVCPGGVPGPPGAVTYSTGTVTLSAGWTTIPGSGVTWGTGTTNVKVGDFIRTTNATHGGGTPFPFWAQITAVSNTSLTVNRPAPTGVDASAFSYKITSKAMYLSLEATWTDGHTFRALQNGIGCESETAMFALAAHDTPAINGTIMSGLKFSWKTVLGEISSGGTFDPNFYGSGGLMPRAFWYRSGLIAALTLANSIDEYWVRDPELADGIAPYSGLALSFGGGVIGAEADLILNSSTVLIWKNIEQFISRGFLGATACNASDTRDSGYEIGWLSLAQIFDPDAGSLGYTTAMQANLTRDQGCVRTTGNGYSGAELGSFAQSFAWNPTGFGTPNALTLTNGSTAVTGTGFVDGRAGTYPSYSGTTPSYCYGYDIITLTVTNGFSAATVASGSLGQRNLIYFYDNVTPRVGVYEYTVSGASVQLAGVWTGASGTFSAMSTGGGPIVSGGQVVGGYGSIWTDNNENFAANKALEKVWACKFNSSTSLTLFRPWDAANGSGYHVSYFNIGAFSQQPFFTGIKANQMRWASLSGNSTIANGYAALQPALGNWYGVYGFDQTNSKGSFYDAVYGNPLGACGSPTDVAAGTFQSIHGLTGCGIAAQTADVGVARTFSAEGGAAMIQYYLADPTPTRKAVVDSFMGAIFGLTAYCAASVLSTCDNIPAANLTDGDLSSSKWPGFFFGMGGFFANSWPAIRQSSAPTGSGSRISGATTISGHVVIH